MDRTGIEGGGAGSVDTRTARAELMNPRLIFRRELKPALRRESEAEEFGRLIRTYEVTLNAAAWDQSLHDQEKDVVASAQFVVGNISARKEFETGENTISP